MPQRRARARRTTTTRKAQSAGEFQYSNEIGTAFLDGLTFRSKAVQYVVADADQGVERARDLRGRVVLPPMDIPIGRFAVLADPAGAAFTVAAFPGGAFRGVDGS